MDDHETGGRAETRRPLNVTYARMLSRINAQVGKRSTPKLAK